MNHRCLLLLLCHHFLSIASAFQLRLPTPRPPPQSSAITPSSLHYSIDISHNAPRDIPSFRDWASNYGIQTTDGFELIGDNTDIFAVTNQDVPADSALLYVPRELFLTASGAMQELGAAMNGAEHYSLDPSDCAAFYLFVKVLTEYELGEEEGSPWYGWLNSLPRYYSNGASMTDFCFGCLPPYAAGLALAEKTRLRQFVQALADVPFLGYETKGNEDLTRWAYNVVFTRYMELPNGDLCLVPMADYLNHGGAQANAYITYDEEGNCYAYAACDIPAGQPLHICYGDPTNPSSLLARYGFLDESSSATFCKYIINHPSLEVYNLGYPSRMLFYNDGSVSQEVWDVLLYEELAKNSNEQQQAFYRACISGDEATKQSYHNQYYPQTLAALQEHVDGMTKKLNELSVFSWQTDFKRHPRLPLLSKHNEFIWETFELVRQRLDSLSA
eukprot:CCRYP_010569-RA/>CCRYP_010569-RA protein AED:0.07 eAED:0.07 QI:164/1/1/1/0/0.5/2/544/443